MGLTQDQVQRLTGRFAGLQVATTCTVTDSLLGEQVILDDRAVVVWSRIGDRCRIGKAAQLTEAWIGDDVVIGDGARILPGARVGDGQQIGAGAVVGADGTPGAVQKLREFILERLPLIHVVKKWHEAKGDETLRLDYELKKGDLLLDVGGYMGDWAQAMVNRHDGVFVEVFEPVRGFAEGIRGKGLPGVRVHDFGLAGRTCEGEISLDSEGSSVLRGEGKKTEKIRLVAGCEALDMLGISGTISVIKINIEGCEFDLLEHFLQRRGVLERIKNIQIQFHDFVPDARARRRLVRSRLAETHVERWNYPFVWEGWQRKA
jgi:FkbM family methyltransferase